MSGSLPIFFGYGLIAVAALAGFALLALRHPKTTSGISFCLALVTIGFACTYLPYLQRIHIGVIKIEMAESAAHILALEKQAAELTGEVNQKRQELAALSKRSGELEKDNNAGQEMITRLRQQQELMTFYLRAGILEDRDSLDELERRANDKSYLEQETARDYWNRVINVTAAEGEQDWSKTSWASGLDGLDLIELEKRFASITTDIPGRYTKLAIVEVVETRSDISKKDKLRFLAKIIEQEKDLKVSLSAGRYFIQIAALGFSPFARREILVWWKDNADKIK